MSSILPQKLRTHIPLSVLFDDLGRHYFGQKWDGTERSVTEIPSLPDAQAMITEEKQLAEKVDKRFGRSDDEHLARVDFETDLDEYGIWMDGEEEYANRANVTRLIHLRKDLRSMPAPNDEQNYCAKYDAFNRKSAVETLIVELLVNQRLFAYHRTEQGRQTVLADRWTSTAIEFSIDNSSVIIQASPLVGVEFEAKQVNELIRILPKEVTTLGGSKKPSRQTVRDELVALIRQPPSELTVKKDFKSIIKEKFLGLSDREFDRIWTEAIEITGSTLNRAGRRSTTKS